MIIITEKSKNLETGEKTKTQKETEYMSDWLNALNKWVEDHTESESSVWSRIWKNKKNRIEFVTTKAGVRYKLRIEWVK